jgi:MFS family permease
MPIFIEREKKAGRKKERLAQPQPEPITSEVAHSSLELSHAEKQEGQKRMIQEGAFWSVMNSITIPGGIVLTAFALYLGADVFVIGLLTALPLLAALLQLWTPQLVNTFGSRKAVAVNTLGPARLLLIPLVALALGAVIWPNLAAVWLILFLLLLTAHSGLTAIGATAWLSWATTVIPLEKRAVYFARRNTIIGVVGLVAALLTGFFLDWWTEPALTATGHRTHPGAYVVLFIIAATAGIISTGALRRTPDLTKPARPPARPSFKASLKATWQLVELRRYLMFRAAWLFAVGIVGPYYAVYMLENLKLSFTELFFLQNVGALAGLAAFPLWGRLLDKFGCSRILFWTSWLKVIYVMLWAFVVPGDPFWPLVLIYLTLAIDSGNNLASGNLLMNLLPSGTQNVGYFSIFTAVTSLVSAIGPFLAGILIGLIANAALPVLGVGMGAIQLMFLLSGLLRAISMIFFRGFSDKTDQAAPA